MSTDSGSSSHGAWGAFGCFARNASQSLRTFARLDNHFAERPTPSIMSSPCSAVRAGGAEEALDAAAFCSPVPLISAAGRCKKTCAAARVASDSHPLWRFPAPASDKSEALRLWRKARLEVGGTLSSARNEVREPCSDDFLRPSSSKDPRWGPTGRSNLGEGA